MAEVVDSSQNPWEFYARSLVVKADKLLAEKSSLAELNEGLRAQFGEREEIHTYVLGTFLGAALIEREQKVGPGYAQAFLSSLAHGCSLSEAEVYSQIVRKTGLPLAEVFERVKPRLEKGGYQLEDTTTYGRIGEVVNEVGFSD
jgi:hypothetical protein